MKTDTLKKKLHEIYASKVSGLPQWKRQNAIRSVLRAAKTEGALAGTIDYYMVHDDPLPTIQREAPCEFFEQVSYFEDETKTGCSFSNDVFKAGYTSSFEAESLSATEAIFTYSLFYGNKRGRLKISLEAFRVRAS